MDYTFQPNQFAPIILHPLNYIKTHDWPQNFKNTETSILLLTLMEFSISVQRVYVMQFIKSIYAMIKIF